MGTGQWKGNGEGVRGEGREKDQGEEEVRGKGTGGDRTSYLITRAAGVARLWKSFLIIDHCSRILLRAFCITARRIG